MLKLQHSIFLVACAILLGSCASYQPIPFSKPSLTKGENIKSKSGLTYKVSQIHPDTADQIFEVEDLRSLNVLSYLLQVDNQSDESYTFSSPSIEGNVPTVDVYQKIKKPAFGILAIDLTASTMISYVGSFQPYIVAPLAAFSLGHYGIKANKNAQRKKYMLEQAPISRQINAGENAEIIFFIDTVETTGRILELKGSKGNQVEIEIPENPFGQRYTFVNASTGIIIRENETYTSIAEQYDIPLANLYSFNDLDEATAPELNAGDVLFINSKKKKGNTYSHVVKEGDTMHSLSQQYAIRLSSLYYINRMEEGQEPKVGEILVLKGDRKSAPALK